MGYLDHSLQPRNDLLLNSATAFGSLFSLSLYGAVKDKKKTFTHNSYDVVASSFSCHVFFVFLFLNSLESRESAVLCEFVCACVYYVRVCVCSKSISEAFGMSFGCLLLYSNTAGGQDDEENERKKKKSSHIWPTARIGQKCNSEKQRVDPLAVTDG